jgi:hypothetical protein
MAISRTAGHADWTEHAANQASVVAIQIPAMTAASPAITALRTSHPEAAGPVLPMHFRKGDVSLRLFTTIATLGTPQDVTLQELRIECFFPMDEGTAETLRGWAAHASSCAS